MSVYDVLLTIAMVTTGISAGVFFTFTTLVVPGLRDAGERGALKGFQTIDRRLQPTAPSRDWQPIFGLVVFGTSLLIPLTLMVGWDAADGTSRVLLLLAALTYGLGFWVPTIATILPFNNRVRDMDVDSMTDEEVSAAYRDFERNWRGWNLLRTATTTLAAVLVAVVAV